jgi:hypothetical protein
MTKLLVVCLAVVLSLPVNETFILADRVGNPPRPYFRFSTSVAKYTIRYDGFVEAYVENDMGHMRKRVFFLSMTGKGRLEHVYYLEHEGDLLLRYDVMGQGSYLTRIEQKSRRQKWVTTLSNISAQAPMILGDKVIVGDTIEIRKTDGRIVSQD